MSQPEISPLARRLAEENNVDWRGLHGSGAGGKVVERDVLEFLARVMAGEEDVDPTPEPVPEGMEGWPEADVRTFQQEVQASRNDAGLDEIQRELSASDLLSGRGADAGPGPELAEPAMEREADQISEDIFLFEDDGSDTEAGAGAASPPAGTGRAPYAGVPGVDDGDDELLVAGEDTMDVAGSGGADALGSGAADGGVERALHAADAGAAGEQGPSQGVEGAQSHVGEEAGPVSEAAADLPDVFGDEKEQEDEARWVGAGAALFEEESGEAARDALEVPSLGELDGGGGARFGQGAGTDAAEPGTEEATWDVDAGPAEPRHDEAPARPVFGEEPGGATEEASFAAERAEEAARGDRLPAEEPVAREGAAGAEVPPSPHDLPLVNYGALLRRHVDVTALAGAQLAVGLELGEREPLPPGPFLLRAAAKAVAEEGWGDGSVAFVGFHRGGVHALRQLDAAGMPFLELVRALAVDGGDEGPASLSVVDMSALDVDEAVLDVDGPQLTLGRILYDNQRGSYRSTLSLAGDVSAERGARLLARVAELLDAPIRLML